MPADPIVKAIVDKLYKAEPDPFAEEGEPMWTITIEQPDGSSLVWITEDPDLAAAFQAAMTDLTGARGDYVAP